MDFPKDDIKNVNTCNEIKKNVWSCLICTCEDKYPMCLNPCGHSICQNCLQKLDQTFKQRLCPNCKQQYFSASPNRQLGEINQLSYRAPQDLFSEFDLVYASFVVKRNEILNNLLKKVIDHAKRDNVQKYVAYQRFELNQKISNENELFDFCGCENLDQLENALRILNKKLATQQKNLKIFYNLNGPKKVDVWPITFTFEINWPDS